MKKNNFKILVTEDIHQIYFDELATANILVDDRSNINSKDELKALLPLYDGVLVRSKFFVDGDLIAGAKNLKLIARAGAGMDNIDEIYCQENNITLINAPEGNRDAVAEHVIGMLLNLMRNISKSNAEIKNGIWLREENRGIEIGGKTIGIIGYGNTGKALAKKLSGFGVQVIAYDKYLTNYSDQFAQEVSLNELQNRADIISIHVPLTVETKYLIDAAFLANLKTGVVILNASRGPVLQTAALIQYINNGKVAYAALDVLENEKIDQLNADEQATFDLLCKESKVLLTSHIAGWTEASYYKIASVLAQKTIQFFSKAIN
jgi:D-3-phosphoglycerate dehydrogenase